MPSNSLPHPTPKLIVTHESPDADAIGYAYLMAKFAPGFEAYRIAFTNFSNPNQELLKRADSVGDIGGQYSPQEWRFDHHHFKGADSTNTCATKMLWHHLRLLGRDVNHLEPLIEVIHQGDLGRTDPVGIHALLWGFAIRSQRNLGQRLSDEEMMAWGFEVMDLAATWLKRQAKNQAELKDKVVWKSNDELIWAIKHGSAGTGFAAYAEGAQLVVFEGKPIKLAKGTTYPIGISRAPEWQSPDVEEIVKRITESKDYPDNIVNELNTWFIHEAGFFAGRGTPKSPDFDPPPTGGLLSIAVAVDDAWDRETQTTSKPTKIIATLIHRTAESQSLSTDQTKALVDLVVEVIKVNHKETKEQTKKELSHWSTQWTKFTWALATVHGQTPRELFDAYRDIKPHGEYGEAE